MKLNIGSVTRLLQNITINCCILVAGQRLQADETTPISARDMLKASFAQTNGYVLQCEGHFEEYGPGKPTEGEAQLNIATDFQLSLDLTGQTRLRITLKPVKRRWIDGPEQFLTTGEEIAFNGKYWVSTTSGWTKDNNPTKIKEALISNKLPSYIGDSHSETTENFLLPRTTIMIGAAMRTFEDVVFDQSVDIKYKYDKLDGLDVIVVDISDSSTTQKLYCDPKRGFALLKKYSAFGISNKDAPPLVDVVVIKDIREVSPGIWLPAAGTREMTRGGKLLCRQTMQISSLKLASVSKSNDDFDATIPPGCNVIDERYGIQFTAGSTPDDVAKTFKAQKN
jgi:hypothetical protein